MRAGNPGAAPVCVFCRKHPVDPRWRPFCSERCKLQDLAKWADGSYSVPGEPEDALQSEGENVESKKEEGKGHK